MRRNLYSLIPLLVLFYTAKSQSADFNYTTSSGLFCHPETVTFTQNCTGNPLQYVWDFGNGERGTGFVNKIHYNEPGSYNVTLLVIYDTTAATVTKTVTIYPTPTMTLLSDKSGLCQPGSAKFSANSSVGLVSYEWNFGDSSNIQTTNVNNITHPFSDYGPKLITVKGVTENGCISNASYNLNIAKIPISGTLDSAKGCIPATVTLTINTAFPNGDTIKNILWNFGDGSPQTNSKIPTVKHIYTTTDTITNAKIIVTSNQGCINDFTFAPFAYGTPPYATTLKITDNIDSSCASKKIEFIAKATDANLYEWDMGDGTKASSIDTFITHKYRKLDDQLIVVKPSFNGCYGDSAFTKIFIKAPIGDYRIGNSCGNKNAFSFTNLSVGTVSNFKWVFTEEKIVTDTVNYNTAYTFPRVGSFESQLIANNNETGCSDTTIKNIYLATPSFHSNTTKVCKDSTINFTVSNTYDPASNFQYEFHTTGSIKNNGTDSILNIKPNKFGTFTNYVVIKDGNKYTCDDTLYTSSEVLVRGPIINFKVPAKICLDAPATYTNLTKPFVAGDNIVSWQWELGDGIKDPRETPLQHYYKDGGYYYVKLTATDINNCSQTDDRPLPVFSLPIISVFPKMKTVCLNSTAELRAFTLDTLTWMPVQGIDCNNCDTINVRPTSSSKYIAYATDKNGCKKYDTASVKVNMPTPIKIFPADTSICFGKTIKYNFSGGGRVTWEPPLFVSNNSIGNPIVKPDSSMAYKVINTDSAGCFTDTSIVNIEVHTLPIVNAGENKTLPYSSSFTITPNYSKNIYQYQWTPSTNLYCDKCPTPTGTLLDNVQYKIEGTDIHGCKAWDSVYVSILCEKSNLLMPTAFSPNGDGKNDYFYPIARGYKEIRSFVIFNRLGQRVFERKNFLPNIPNLGWGQSQYNTTNNESFVWFIEAECSQGEIITSRGSVLLIK
ncbi:MAG: PKD domain-containing protein [Bacteroidota bacterium]